MHVWNPEDVQVVELIIESENVLGWKDLKDHLVPTPYYGQGHFPLDHVAQSPTQLGQLIIINHY